MYRHPEAHVVSAHGAVVFLLDSFGCVCVCACVCRVCVCVRMCSVCGYCAAVGRKS